MVETDKAFIASKIREARKKIGMKQGVLAKEIGISANHITRIEQGIYVPSLETFLKMAQVLQLDLKEFGIEISDKKTSARDELIKIIDAADDKEQEIYLSSLKMISENINYIKNLIKSENL